MSLTAAISGGLGDAIYGLQVCKAMGVKRLLIKDIALEDGSTTFKALERLVRSQGIEPIPIEGGLPPFHYPEGTVFDIDLDQARKQPRRGKNHILLSFANAFKQKIVWKKPWLQMENRPGIRPGGEYSLIMLTPRWRDNSTFDWCRLREKIDGPAYFIGFEKDWVCFKRKYWNISRIYTSDLFDVMDLISGCKHFYCNQNPGLAIVQGLGGIDYSCEFKPGKTNTMLYSTHENYLR